MFPDIRCIAAHRYRVEQIKVPSEVSLKRGEGTYRTHKQTRAHTFEFSNFPKRFRPGDVVAISVY